MKIRNLSKILSIVALLFLGCKKNEITPLKTTTKLNTEVQYAQGFTIQKYREFTLLQVTNPWPNAHKSFTYVLHKKNNKIPDSLKKFTHITIPIQSIIVTSTTHIPSLEMLGVENSLIGFPNLDYISSPKVRTKIDAGTVAEIGKNNDLNTEKIISLSPSVIIGYGIDNNNATFDNLEKSGLKVFYNGDWNEETPLGKAEWIKFFGVLYDKSEKANAIFNSIATDYNRIKLLAKNSSKKPTILSGAMFGDQWFLPKGKSWGSYFLKDAHANYLWSDTKGTGSLSLSFETVFEKAQNAEFWIGPGQFTSLTEIAETNNHYTQLAAFQTKNVYSFSNKKGITAGVLYYELAPNRPDLVLKDLVKILHPELLPNYKLYFYEKLK